MMLRYSWLAVMASVVSTGIFIPACSGDEDDDTRGGPGGLDLPDGTDRQPTSTPPSVPDSAFHGDADVTGDGVVTVRDIVESGAGSEVTKEALDAFQQQSCAAWQHEPEPLAASLFFVVDASSSMDAAADNTNGQSKWVATREAIADAIRDMPDGSQVGLLGYPNMLVGAECVNRQALRPADFLGVSRLELLEALDAIETETCTPTDDAYNIAVEAFAQQSTSGQKYMLLMTDGQPTITRGCYPGDGSCGAAVAGDGAMQDVIDSVAAAREDHDIKTFILGSPGSEEHMDTGNDNRWWLSQAAEVGGTSPGGCSHDAPPYCHFDMTVETDFSSGLQAALGEIIGMVARCEYEIPPPPDDEQVVDKSAIHLVFAAGGKEYVEIYQAPTSTCTHGWYLDGEQVRLCPASCEAVQADPMAELQWLFGCGGQDIQTVQ